MTTVVDRDGRLVGVITDGDLRRLMRHGEPVGTQRAGDIATRMPKTIAAEALAAHALDVMERSGPITSLVVVDDAGRPRRRHPSPRHPAREDRLALSRSLLDAARALW